MKKITYGHAGGYKDASHYKGYKAKQVHLNIYVLWWGSLKGRYQTLLFNNTPNLFLKSPE